MAQEIERKFLVVGDFKSMAISNMHIVQGYLSSNPDRTVRIRIYGDRGFITIKGSSNASGVSRYEWEKEISVLEAQELLSICEPGTIDKTRYIVPEKLGLKFEVDIFHGANTGLIIAEIELPTEDHPFSKPPWLGKEVTGETKYYNAMLSKTPKENWNN